MSNPNAVSFLAKLVSYYSCNGDILDDLGPNDMGGGTDAYESGGKFGGQRLAAGTRGGTVLASPIAYGVSSGQFFVGGWAYYFGTPAFVGEFGLSKSFGASNEVLTVHAETGYLGAFGWEAGATTYNAVATEAIGIDYFPEFEVEDTNGLTATAIKRIRIRDASEPMQEGWYFVIAQYDAGAVSLYAGGSLVGTDTATGTSSTSVTHFQFGQQYGPANTAAALSGLFFGTGVVTADEVTYLYNDGAGKSLSQIQADAA